MYRSHHSRIAPQFGRTAEIYFPCMFFMSEESPPLSPNFPERQTVRTFSDRPSGKAEPKVNAVPPIDRTYVHGASRLLKIILSI